MAEFTTKIDLLHDSIYIKELKLKHFKILLKTLISDDNIENIYYNLVNIILEITSLTQEQIEQLSIIDFLLVVMYIRCISTGNIIELEILGEENKKISLNLYKVIDTLINYSTFNPEQNIKDIKIFYTPPSIKEYLFPTTSNSELLTIKKFIKTITISNYQTLNITDLDDTSFTNFLKQLPAIYSTAIFKHITQLITDLNNINLLNYITEHNLSLYLTPENFVFILQILFSKNLLPLYDNIFALCKFTNLTPEYLENSTPGEYTIFVKLLERILKEQSAQQNKNTLPPINADNPKFM